VNETRGTYTALFMHTTYDGIGRPPSRSYFEVVVHRPPLGRVTQRFPCPACEEVFIFDVLSKEESILRRQFNLMRLAILAVALIVATALALWAIVSPSASGTTMLVAVVVFCLTLWVGQVTSSGNVVVSLRLRRPGRRGHRIR
jgi:hypothetical protein